MTEADITNISLDAYLISLQSNFAKTGDWKLNIAGSSDSLDAWQPNSTGFFQFQGKDISLYGREDPLGTSDVPVQSSYSINGTELGAHTSSPNGTDNVLFFHTDDLPPGLHALTISVLQASNTSRYHLTLLEYNQTQIPSTTGGTPASTSSTSSHAANNGPTLSPHISAVIGGAVGGGVLLFLIVAILFWWLKGRRVKRLGGEFSYGTKGHYDAAAAAANLSSEAEQQRQHSEDHGLLLAPGPATASDAHATGAMAEVHDFTVANVVPIPGQEGEDSEELPQGYDDLMDDEMLPPYAP